MCGIGPPAIGDKMAAMLLSRLGVLARRVPWHRPVLEVRTATPDDRESTVRIPARLPAGSPLRWSGHEAQPPPSLPQRGLNNRSSSLRSVCCPPVPVSPIRIEEP
jgi:hypothetical protein